jgi:hypothetical protein
MLRFWRRSIRHRGKGQQKGTVEHVHVHNGGQAIVGNVGGGMQTKSEDQPHALGYAPGQEMRSTNTEREALSVARDDKRSLPNARRTITGAPKGNQHA